MKANLCATSLLILGTTLSLLGYSRGLQCWNCVGPDCDGSMKNSEFAKPKTCDPGAVCQKTYFHWFDHVTNNSFVTHAVRSCSYPIGCQESRPDACMRNWRQHASSGCHERYCCDSSFCNKAPELKVERSTVIFKLLITSGGFLMTRIIF